MIWAACLLISIQAKSAFVWTDNVRHAYDAILDLRFSEGQQWLAREKSQQTGNGLVPYVENYIDFLTLLIGEEEAEFKVREKHKEERLKLIEKNDDHSPWYLLSQAEMHLQWAFARLKFKEYLTAAREIHKAYRLLQRNEEKFPGFIPNQKSLGLLHAAIGSIPEDYDWVKGLVGVEGSIHQGIQEMKGVLDAAIRDPELGYLKTETFFLLTFVQLNLELEGGHGTEDLARYARELYPQNEISQKPLFLYACARIAMSEGSNEEVIRLLRMAPTSSVYFPFHYLDYLLGVALQNRLDPQCVVYLQRYVKMFKGTSYLKSAYQRMAWEYLIGGNAAAYAEAMSLVDKYGNDEIGADKQAQRAYDSKETPNVQLLKARLLFDGGYYTRARQALLEKGSSSVYKSREEQVEFMYRLGRIYHEGKNTEKALYYYDLTLHDGKDLPLYYAANAALQAGLIHENAGAYDKAREYFNTCLSLKDHQYRLSLSQKAKAGLHRLDERKPE
ncbi:MAG: hypothetical protein KDD36_11420 [Flavobacteriales bacterium]|nr:hypothetical protein [Flavobacteriales bacterium]